MKLILVTHAVLGGLAACSRGGAPEAAIEEMGRISESGNCERLPQLISASTRDTFGPKLEAACREEVERRKTNPPKNERKLKQINVLQRTENGEDRVTLRAEPEFEDGSKEAAQDFVMVREEGEWRIDLLATGMAAHKGGAGK